MKSIITKYITFCLCDKRNKARLSMYLPMQYSLADILHIISEYTDYKNKFSWNIHNPYRKELVIKNAMEKDELDHISFAQFRDTTPGIVITYGSTCILVESSKTKKVAKCIHLKLKQAETSQMRKRFQKKNYQKNFCTIIINCIILF